MTVKELMEKLKKAKPDMEVVIERYNTNYCGDVIVETVYLYDDYIHTTDDMFIIDIKAEGQGIDIVED